MLSPREQELLTAHVDGELTPRQRCQVAQLLHRSGEARTLLAKLEDDVRQLRSLPRLNVPVDLSTALLETIATEKLRPGHRLRVPAQPPLPAPTYLPAWTGLAAAAAVLLLVGVGSFLLHTHSRSGLGSDERPGVALQQPGDDGADQEGAGKRAVVKKLDRPIQKDKPRPPDDGAKGREPHSTPPIESDPPERLFPHEDPAPARPDPAVLASGQREPSGKFERVELTLPTVLRLHNLDRPAQDRALFEQLHHATSWRIELPARDATRGFEHVRAALAKEKVQLLLDPAAQVRLPKPLWRTDYAIFLENVPLPNVMRVLRAVGMADQPGSDRKVEPRFDGALVLKPLSRRDRQELRELLGIDPVRVRPSLPVPVKIDIHRPLPEQTDELVMATLAGRGIPRPGTTQAITGFVTPLSGPRSRSAELKRFLDGRQIPRPGTLQVFLVLRNVGP